jgi:hypothetical protein
MKKMDLNNLSDQDKANLEEMLAFWDWMRGLNNLLKWLVLIGAPISIAVWGLHTWIKKH